MLPREHRLRSSAEIREVVGRGKRYSNEAATIHFLPADTNRFAIVVSKSVGQAVVRNLVKRRVRAILRSEIGTQPAISAVLRMRPTSAQMKFAALSPAILDLVGKAR